MRVDLYIAATLDGFIADEHGNTDWVLDDGLFAKTVQSYGCICMGRTTYSEYGGPAFKDVTHIVLTHKIPKRSKSIPVHFVTSVEEAMAKAKGLGFKKMLVIGGAQTNQSFMQAQVVRRVFTDIHPILLKNGLQMFGDFKAKFDFKMAKHTWYGAGFMHAEYVIGQTHTAIAGIIIRDEQGNYFVHRRRANKKYFPGRFGLGAGGKISDNEEPEQAAKRELFEETGLKTKLRHCFTIDYADKTLEHTMYVFETTVKKQKNYKNPSEWDKEAWVDAEQLNELAEAGKLCDDTKVIYQKYRETLQ